MMPPDIMFFLQQRHQEIMRQAERARLVRAERRRPERSGRVFKPVLWLAGSLLLSWGCSLQRAGLAMAVTEKGCCLCLQ
jgi:hypothetical protein